MKCSRNSHDIPFPDNHFEVVCNREVMHLMPDPMKMMREVVRVLKPGGQFVVGQILPFGPEGASWMYRVFKKKQPLLYHMFQDEDFEKLWSTLAWSTFKNKIFGCKVHRCVD